MQVITSDSFQQAVDLHRKGQVDAAEKLYLQIIEQDPQQTVAICNLAYLNVQKKNIIQALEYIQKAIAADPEYGNAYNVLGIIQTKQGKMKEAIASFDKAIEKKSATKDTFNNMAYAAVELKDFVLAAKAWRSYLQLAPFSGMAVSSLMHCVRRTMVWHELELLEEKIRNLVNAKEGNMPSFPLLFSQLNPEQLKAATVSRSHYLRQKHGDFQPPKKAPHVSGTKIKVGYFSSDIKAHPVGMMTQHLYKNHDRSEFEIYAYAAFPPDNTPVSKSIIRDADHYRDLSGLSDDAAANAVRADDLDILVDLSGYTKNTRQEILLRRPAPVIINYLGFIGTMGSDYHNYIIADQYLIPENQRRYFTETPIYVSCAYAYERTYLEPQRIGTRQDHNLPEDAVVLGCFNQGAKINPTVFNAWMRVMQACPKAHLWLPRHDEAFEANFKTLASGYNIPARRMTFGDVIEVQFHQGRYEHIDIVPDTFPYNGGITSTDALYAGVPLVTFPGRNMIGRVGASLLLKMGLNDLIAQNTSDYIEKLRTLISAPEKLRSIRPEIKKRALESGIFDGQKMTRELEECYRRIVNLRQP